MHPHGRRPGRAQRLDEPATAPGRPAPAAVLHRVVAGEVDQPPRDTTATGPGSRRAPRRRRGRAGPGPAGRCRLPAVAGRARGRRARRAVERSPASATVGEQLLGVAVRERARQRVVVGDGGPSGSRRRRSRRTGRDRPRVQPRGERAQLRRRLGVVHAAPIVRCRRRTSSPGEPRPPPAPPPATSSAVRPAQRRPDDADRGERARRRRCRAIRSPTPSHSRRVQRWSPPRTRRLVPAVGQHRTSLAPPPTAASRRRSAPARRPSVRADRQLLGVGIRMAPPGSRVICSTPVGSLSVSGDRRTDGLDGPHRVDDAGALEGRLPAEIAWPTPSSTRLTSSGRPTNSAVHRQERGGRAGDVRRGHRRPGVLDVGAAGTSAFCASTSRSPAAALITRSPGRRGRASAGRRRSGPWRRSTRRRSGAAATTSSRR